MTEPTQSGPYAGQPAPPPQPSAPAPGWAPPPQQGGPYPYATTPPVGHGRPATPPGNPAAVSDRVSGALLILGAALTIGASFTTLDTSVQYLDKEHEEPAFQVVAKAWSYTSGGTGEEMESVTRFTGVPLLIGALVAVAAAVLLLTGRARRLRPGPALGVGGAVLLLGATLSALTEVVNDGQWDGDDRATTLGVGAYLLALAFLSALGATVTTVLATGRPTATALPGPAPTAYPVPTAYPAPAAFPAPQPPQAPQAPQPQQPAPPQAPQPPQAAQPWPAAPVAQPTPTDQSSPPTAPPTPSQG